MHILTKNRFRAARAEADGLMPQRPRTKWVMKKSISCISFSSSKANWKARHPNSASSWPDARLEADSRPACKARPPGSRPNVPPPFQEVVPQVFQHDDSFFSMMRIDHGHRKPEIAKKLLYFQEGFIITGDSFLVGHNNGRGAVSVRRKDPRLDASPASRTIAFGISSFDSNFKILCSKSDAGSDNRRFSVACDNSIRNGSRSMTTSAPMIQFQQSNSS